MLDPQSMSISVRLSLSRMICRLRGHRTELLFVAQDNGGVDDEFSYSLVQRSVGRHLAFLISGRFKEFGTVSNVINPIKGFALMRRHHPNRVLGTLQQTLACSRCFQEGWT